MSIPVIGLLVGLSLGLGGLVALRFTKWLCKDNDRKVVLMGGVTAWLVLFGLIPFALFAFLVRNGTSGAELSDYGFPVRFVLGVLPFTLLASPVIGYLQALAVSRSAEGE